MFVSELRPLLLLVLMFIALATSMSALKLAVMVLAAMPVWIPVGLIDNQYISTTILFIQYSFLS